MRISFASQRPSDALALYAMCWGGRVDCAPTRIDIAQQVPH
jgi:hypothetical protein